MADEVIVGDELDSRLARLESWSMVDGKLHRSIEFENFADAFAFMTRVALAAERLDHHPDWSNSWGTVTIDIVSHVSGGITERCLTLARACDGAAVRAG